LRPKSTLATAIGVKHSKIVQIAQGAMGGSFNTREFFHGRPREVVRAARWCFLALGFPLPGASVNYRFASKPARGIRPAVRGTARRALVLLRRSETSAESLLPGDLVGYFVPRCARMKSALRRA
jgi:hypothetical protein